MKLGVFTRPLGEKPLAEALDDLKALGVEAVEFGAGASVPTGHFPTEELLHDDAKLAAVKNAIEDRQLEISALSCHGNPLHPDRAIAGAHHQDFANVCMLARKLDVHQINMLSGCPAGDAHATTPNWIVCPFPAEDFEQALAWQWDARVVPYWLEAATVARDNGVRIGIEMVPNNVVYSVETLFRLREAVGDVLGANLDPSHLFWQGVDIGAAIRELGDAIYHFHAKDAAVNPYVAAVNGVLDGKALTDEPRRSWIFRTLGCGHGEQTWNEIITQLRMVGYDGVLSIEHEDSLMSPEEGLTKAIAFLSRVLIREKPGVAFWVD